MRDPARIDRILEKLRAAWITNPDSRINQLLNTASHLGSENEDAATNDLYYIEDDVVERGLDKLNGL